MHYIFNKLLVNCLIGVVRHGAEFVAGKRLVTFPNPGLSEDGWSGRIEPDHYGDKYKEWGQEYEGNQTNHKIEQPLDQGIYPPLSA